MAPRRQWTRDETLKLLNEYKKCNCLWDPKHPQYRTQQATKQALQNLADMFDTNNDELARKVHNLKTQFGQEKRKLDKIRGKEPNARSKWEYYYIMLEFMTNRVESPRLNTANKRKSSPSNNTNSKILKLQELLKSSETDKSDVNDEYKIFGDYVANEMRNMKSLEHKGELKREILKLIVQYTEKDEKDFLSVIKPNPRQDLAETPSSSTSQVLIEYAPCQVKSEVVGDDDEDSEEYYSDEITEQEISEVKIEMFETFEDHD